MKQMNEMSARALSMEELENVNGGRVMFQGGYKIKEKIEKIKNIIDIDKKRYRVIA